MSVIRVEHSKNYTCISNKAIRDKSISFKARGLHHLLLSFPDQWTINTEHLTQESDKDGRDAIASGLRELEKAGYITRQRTRDPKSGKLGWESVIRELPINGFSGDGQNQQKPSRKKKKTGSAINGLSSDGSASDGSASDGSASDGKSGAIINTDLSSTDLSNTDLSNTYSLKTASQIEQASAGASNGSTQGDRSAASNPYPNTLNGTTGLNNPISQESQSIGEDQFSAPLAPNNFLTKKYIHPTEQADRQFQGESWGSYSKPDPDFLDYLTRVYLPTTAHYQKTKPTRHHARKWLNAAKYDEQRHDDALIQWEAYQEWRSAREQQPAGAVEPLIDIQQQRIETLNAMLRRGEVQRVKQALEANPTWQLQLSPSQQEVITANGQVCHPP